MARPKPAPAPPPADHRPLMAGLLALAIAVTCIRACAGTRIAAVSLLRDEPPVRMIVFDVDPAGVPGSFVSLVNQDGEQWSIPPNQVRELAIAGKVRWTAHVPGRPSAHGVLEIPAAGEVGTVRIPVSLPR